MKKFLTLLLTVVLTAAVAITGTVAYLQDTDEDVNTMVLGNVKIAQHEYEREVENGDYTTKVIDNVTSYVLKEFTQDKPILPIVGDPNEPGDSPAYAGWADTVVRMTQVDSYGGMQVFAGKNAQDKFVTVENTGKSDAYVRTIVAIEVGSSDGKLIGVAERAVDVDDADASTAPWVFSDAGIIEIAGNNYMVKEYVYRGASDVDRHVNGVLPAGDTTYPNLCQVYLKHNATNEDMVEIDGNGNGKLDILVLSQAVQANGFEAEVNDAGVETKSAAKVALDTAFGEANKINIAEWFVNIGTTNTNP